MTKKLILSTLLFICTAAFAQQTTTDKVTLSTTTLNPGDTEAKVTVSLQGSQLYTGYEMDITLPEGIEISTVSGKLKISTSSSFYSFDEDWEGNKTYNHSVAYSYGEVAPKTLRVSCFAKQNQNFNEESGPLLTIFLKASTLTKPGTTPLALSNCKFITYDAATSTTTGYTVTQTDLDGITVSDQATATINVSAANHWSTCVLPFAYTPSGDLQAYSCSTTDETKANIILTPVSQMQPFTPYILYSEAGFSTNATGTVSTATYPSTTTVNEGLLHGAITPQTVTEGYVLQNQGAGVKCYNIGSTPATIPQGKCWLLLPATSTAKAYSFAFETPTGIETPLSHANTTTPAYLINGTLSKGNKPAIIIKDGKKIAVK